MAQRTDLLLVAPATADIIAKFARGIADDFLTTLYLATTAPVVIAPAMNVNMWQHGATQENVEMLRARGAIIVDPDEGYLACGMTGAGRLAGIEAILGAVRQTLQVERSGLWVEFDLPPLHGEGTHDGIKLMAVSSAEVCDRDGIGKEIQAGKFKWKPELEDVHMNIEAELTKRVPAGAKLHTGRSRNEQVSVDLRLYLMRRLPSLQRGVAAVVDALLKVLR